MRAVPQCQVAEHGLVNITFIIGSIPGCRVGIKAADPLHSEVRW